MLVDEVRETQAAGADVIEWRIDMLFGDHPNFFFLYARFGDHPAIT